MKTTYRKDGWTSRFERTSRSEAWIVLSESGVAEFDGSSFSTSCTGEAPLPKPQGSRVRFLARRISNDVPSEARISRLTITEGRADHRVEDVDGKREWSETFGRIHLAVEAGPLRATIDRGGTSLLAIDPAEIKGLANLLAGAERLLEPRISNIRLAPAVTARILRGLVDSAAAGRLEPEFQVVQTEHEDYPYDGLGHSITRIVLNADAGVPPNVYRPTYRLPPVRVPLHVRLIGPSLAPAFDARAIEILEPFLVRPDRLEAGLLCLDAEGRPLACRVSTSPGQWLAAMRSAGTEYRWFPYSAGAYGNEIDLEGIELLPLETIN